jgi:hypothetical protein
MCEGIADELVGIDLGDLRLDKRSKRVINALAANPEASLHAAIWVGLRRMTDFATAWLAFGPRP